MLPVDSVVELLELEQILVFSQIYQRNIIVVPLSHVHMAARQSCSPLNSQNLVLL